MILAGDIGGTNCRLAVFDYHLNKLSEKVFQNANYTKFEQIAGEFLNDNTQPIDRACFAVAGPVAQGHVSMTNLSWEFDEAALATSMKIGRVALINDLVAHAEGIETLQNDQLICIQRGKAVPGGGRAIIAAGTGLGEAGLFYDNKTNRYRAFPTEGGHCDFSPRSEKEDALLKFMRSRQERVSWESVLSGPGLRHIYDFLAASEENSAATKLPDNPEKSGKGPTPADISTAALSRSSPIAMAALDMFITLYGAEAGNLALKMLATGGLYLGGGIAVRIAAKLAADPAFVAAFSNKSLPKFEPLLQAIPIYIINFDLCGLYGAGNFARHIE